jgi:hypothetical protein
MSAEPSARRRLRKRDLGWFLLAAALPVPWMAAYHVGGLGLPPEWQAIRWALARGVDVRCIDLPQAHRMAEPLDVDQHRGRGPASTPTWH